MKSDTKNVQTSLTPEEHAILADYAAQHNISIKEAVRRGIMILLTSDPVEKEDAFFDIKVESRFKDEKASQDVDKIIYDQK